MKQDGEETQAGGGWESGFLNGGNILFFDLGGIYIGFCLLMVAQLVKNPPAMRETWVQFLGWEDPPGEGKGCSLQCSGLENSMHNTVTESDLTG